jgi:magnesium-transporting ATPase (P-type)
MGKENKTSEKVKEKFNGFIETVADKQFWKSTLPWPKKILRKPTIRLDNPFIGKKLPGFLTSRYLILTLLYGVIFFFFSGGMYFLIGSYREIPMGYTSDDPPAPIIYLSGSLNDQFIIEGILSATFIFICLLGFFLLYLSSKNFYKPTTSYVYFALGIIVILICFFLLEIAMYEKGIRLYDDALYSSVSILI